MNEFEKIKQNLPKTEILRKRKEINEVFEKGHIWNGKYLKCLYIKSNHRKVGFIVSKRHGNAVRRNHAKRMMREIYRKNRQAADIMKILILPKDNMSSGNLKELETDFIRFCQCIKS